MLGSGLAPDRKVKQDATEQRCDVLQDIAGNKAEIEDRDRRAVAVKRCLRPVVLCCRPVRSSIATRRIDAHQRFEVRTERVFVLFDPRDEVVPAISEEPAQSHLEGRDIACNTAVHRLLKLDSRGQKVVAQRLERIEDRSIEVCACVAAAKPKIVESGGYFVVQDG